MDKLRVSQLFSWGRDNPYQELLSESLRKRGLIVEQPKPKIFLLPGLWQHGSMPHILHVQAPNEYFRSRSGLVAHLKVFALLAQLWLLRRLGAKIVWTIHDIRKFRVRFPKQHLRVSAGLARLSHAAIVHCPAATDEVKRNYNLADKCTLHVVPHGNYIGVYPDSISEGAARERLGLPHGPLVLLCFGLLLPYKGIDRMIEPIRSLGSEVHLVIAGRALAAVYKAELTELIASLKNVTYRPGYVAPRDVQVYMRAADAVVFAYPEILTSGAMILAMSYARACIAPRAGCIPETIHPDGGILYEANDRAGLQKALSEALRRRNDLPRMGELNRERVKEWSWDRVGDMTLDVYRACLGRTSK